MEEHLLSMQKVWGSNLGISREGREQKSEALESYY